MFELVLQVLAYTGVGLAVLVVGFIVLDLLTPGKLGQLVMEGNPGAGLIAATGLASLGLILYFAIYFTGAGWDGLDDAAVFGLVGVLAQAVGFFVLDMLIPGKLADALLRAEDAPRGLGHGRDSDLGRAGGLRVADVGQPAGSGERSPRSIECTSSTTASLYGVAIPSSRPRSATPPLTTSTSVARPASRSCSIEGRTLAMAASSARARSRRSRAGRSRGSNSSVSSCASPTATPSAQSAKTASGPCSATPP